MNYIEFKKVLEKFNISSIIGINERYEEIYSWRGIDIAFGGSYYAVVNGSVPYEVARILSKKYPDYRDDVRIKGVSGNKKVEEKNLYLKDSMGNSYIDLYYVTSTMGLVYLLSELKYFYEVRTYTEETRKALYREQKEIIASIYRELIENVEPSYSTEDWKKEHSISIEEEYDEVTTLVKKFDEIVNPYINSDVEVKDPSEFIDKVKMSIHYGDYNDLEMKIDDEGKFVKYNQFTLKNKDYLQYALSYNVKPKGTMSVVHIITDTYDEIRLHFKKNEWDNDSMELHYDMKSGIVYYDYGNAYGEKHQISEEEKQFFINELNKALKLGKKITINRMTKKKNNLTKKLK